MKSEVLTPKSGFPKLFSVFIFLTIFGILQEPVLINFQLLLAKPQLIPNWHLSGFSIVATYVASVYLILISEFFGSVEWWGGFIAMAIPYCILKYIGVLCDYTDYIIADYEGRHISGGAAFGSVPLVFYLMGAAQIISIFGTYFTRKLKERYAKDGDTNLIPW